MAVPNVNSFANLTAADFLAKVNEVGGPAKSCRFAVRITMVDTGGETNLLRGLPYQSKLKNLIYLCDAVEFPGRGFNVSNIRYYGAPQVVPNNVEYGPCNLSFICSNSGLERQFFDDWQQTINPTNSFNFYYPNQYYCDIEIFQFSEYTMGAKSMPPGTVQTFGQATLNKTPDLIYNWKLYKCWPTFVNPQQVTWADSSDILRLQVTFAYKYWDRPRNEVTYTQQQVGTNESAAAAAAAGRFSGSVITQE